MRFFVGMDDIAQVGLAGPAFVSINRLETRRADMPNVGEWILDSGAFTKLLKYGTYPEPTSVYAAQIKRWSTNGKLLIAISQDYMCEPVMLEKTGLTIRQHQILTIDRYDSLYTKDLGSVPLMPVLQGYAPDDYCRHIDMYAGRLRDHYWVGVGSVCKRNGNPRSIYDVLRAIHDRFPTLRLHGFGLKQTALRCSEIVEMLYSADSMAWSFAARMAKRNAHDWREAKRFADLINNGGYNKIENGGLLF